MAEQDMRILSRKHGVHRLVSGNVRRSHGGRRGVSKRRCDIDTTEPAAHSASSWVEEGTSAEVNTDVDWQSDVYLAAEHAFLAGRCFGAVT